MSFYRNAAAVKRQRTSPPPPPSFRTRHSNIHNALRYGYLRQLHNKQYQARRDYRQKTYKTKKSPLLYGNWRVAPLGPIGGIYQRRYVSNLSEDQKNEEDDGWRHPNDPFVKDWKKRDYPSKSNRKYKPHFVIY